MAYVNPEDMTEVMAFEVVENDPDLLTRCANQTDRDIRAKCRDMGVKADQIPVNVDGHTTSDALYSYGLSRLTMHIMLALKGAVAATDSYKELVQDYERQAEKARGAQIDPPLPAAGLRRGLRGRHASC